MNQSDIEKFKKKIVLLYTTNGRLFAAIDEVCDNKTRYLKISALESVLKKEISYDDMKSNDSNFEEINNSEILKIEG